METIRSLQGIIAFVKVAEMGGFSAAAQELGVSKSHISKMITALEQELGVTLFIRSTRKIQLTNLGEKYLATCRDSIGNLQAAKQEILDLSETPQGSLRVSVAGVFGEEYVAPVLIEIAKKYPHLKVELNFTSRVVDLIEEKFDVAIRIGELKDSSLVAQKVASRFDYIVCSKAYLQSSPALKELSDLKNHNCIGERLLWSFKKRGQPLQVAVGGNLKSNNPRVILRAALAGLGIARLPGSYVSEDLRRGRLVSILEQYSEGKKDIWIVTPSSRAKNINVKIFVQEFRRQISNNYGDALF